MGIADLINSSGAKSFSFATVGATVTGQVISSEVIQHTEFGTRTPLFWDDGNPQQLVHIILATLLRESVEPGMPPDDGRRSVYIKWWTDSKAALLAAVRESGAGDVLPGGTFTATYIADGKATIGFPPKLFRYSYTAPSSTAGLLAAPAAAPAVVPPPEWAQLTLPPSQPVAPAPVATPAAAVPPGMTAEQMERFAAWSASQPQVQS